jgi:hypothetical protein
MLEIHNEKYVRVTHFALKQWEQKNIKTNEISRIKKKKAHPETLRTSAENNFLSCIQYGMFQEPHRTPDFFLDLLYGRGQICPRFLYSNYDISPT